MLVAPVARSTTILPPSHCRLGQRGRQVEQRFLAERLDDHVGGEDEIGAGNVLIGPGRDAGSSSSVRRNSTPRADAILADDRGSAGRTTRTGRRPTWRARTRRRRRVSGLGPRDRRSSPSRHRAAWRRWPRRWPCCRRRSPGPAGPTSHSANGLRVGLKDEVERFPDALQVFALDRRAATVRPSPMPRKTASNSASSVCDVIRRDALVEVDVDADLADHLDLGRAQTRSRSCRRRCRACRARRARPALRRRPRRGRACAARGAHVSPAGPEPTTATFLPVGGPGSKNRTCFCGGDVAGMALKAADLHRRLHQQPIDAGALAQNLGRTGTGATAAEDVGLEDRPGRADLVACRIWRMNLGTSMCVGQARVQGASKQNRQRAASTRTSSTASGGGRSAKLRTQASSGLPLTGPEHGRLLSLVQRRSAGAGRTAPARATAK